MSIVSGNIATVAPRDMSRLGPRFGLRLKPALVFAAACFSVVLFALAPTTTRIATTQLDGLSIGLIRTVGAGLLTFPLLLVLRLRPPQKLTDFGLLFLYAFGNFAAFPILFSLGTQRTSGSHAALIMAAMPVFVGVLGMLLDRHLPRLGWFIGAIIALAGEIALVGVGNVGSLAGATFAGDAMVFAACALFAVGVVAGTRLSSRMNPLAATLWAITLGGLGLAPLAAIHFSATADAFQHLTGTTWAALLHIAFGAAVVANVSWLWALSRGGLVRIAPIQFAQPICALFFAATLLHEHVTASLLLVAAVILLGTITACRGARTKPIAAQRPSSTWLSESTAKMHVGPIFRLGPLYRAATCVLAVSIVFVLCRAEMIFATSAQHSASATNIPKLQNQAGEIVP